MLDRGAFKKEIGRLVIEYGDKGFTMSKEKAEQWYERLKEIEDPKLKAAVDEILDNCNYAPCMADIIKRIPADKIEKVKPVKIMGRIGD